MSIAGATARAAKPPLIVGISELIMSDVPDDTIITYSLGSCIGVSLYDPLLKIGGLIHCMLPLSTGEPERAADKPCMYVDTGMTKFLQELFNRGVQRKNILCRVAGGGSPHDDNGVFRIGERNYSVLRKILWKNNILIKGELVGGNDPKTMVLDMASGRTFIRLNGKNELELK